MKKAFNKFISIINVDNEIVSELNDYFNWNYPSWNAKKNVSMGSKNRCGTVFPTAVELYQVF